MDKKLQCISVIQNKRGLVQFAEVSEKGQPSNLILVTVNVSDVKEAAKFEVGKEYTVTIKPS